MSESVKEFSEWLHDGLVREYAHETEQWAKDRVTRVQHRLNEQRGPERENDAHEYALKLCARSGFNIDVAGEALQIIENIALDAGDVSGVFDPENLLDPTDPNRSSYAYRAQEWVWTRMNGYYPIHERLMRVRDLNRKIKNGTVRI